MKFDLLREKAYSMGENIQNLWTAPSMGDAMKYWNSCHSWVIHSSIDTIKDVARITKDPPVIDNELLSSQDHQCKGRKYQ